MPSRQLASLALLPKSPSYLRGRHPRGCHLPHGSPPQNHRNGRPISREGLPPQGHRRIWPQALPGPGRLVAAEARARPYL